MTDVLPQTTPQTAAPAPQRLEGEQLEEAVIKQIDYYFSRHNLSTDAYLVSQMDSEMWVPVAIIAGFKKVHMLTHDADFILRVMAKSSNVVVDTQRQAIKPSWKLQRNTLILRDIPSDAPEEEVRQLFEKFPVTAVHSDVGDTWFVTLDSEDTALDALMHLKNVTFREKSVKARMKAEHLLKSSPAQAYTQPYAVDPYYAYAQYAQRVPYQQQVPYWEGQQDQNKDRRPYRGGAGGGRRGQGAHTGAQAAGAPAVGQPAQAGQHGGRPRGNSHGQGQAPFKGDGAQPSSGGKGRGRKGKKSTEAKPAVSNGTHPSPSVIVPQLNQQHFPSLPSPSGRPNKASFKSGYTADFRRFTKDDILRIINTVQDVSTRPANVIGTEPGVVESKPNTTLEISKVPVIPEASLEEEEESDAAPVAAPGVAIWPIQKSPPPPTPVAAAAASPSPAPATTPAPSTTTASPAPSVAAPTPKKEAPLRKSAEQSANGDSAPVVPSSPSINSSSDAVRSPSYAAIALGVARTNSPPIAGPVKSPSLTSASQSTSIPPASLANAPPAPSTTSLEGKPQ